MAIYRGDHVLLIEFVHAFLNIPRTRTILTFFHFNSRGSIRGGQGCAKSNRINYFVWVQFCMGIYIYSRIEWSGVDAYTYGSFNI